jgi:hypothetical protein
MKTNIYYDICAIKAAIKMGSQLLKELYNLGCIEEPELWEPIKGYKNFYVSNMGRVYNAKTENIVGTDGKAEYLTVSLSEDGVSKTKTVHRLVAEAFCPKPADSKVVPMIVDHINRNKHDNRASNLRWVTYSQNSKNKVVTVKREGKTTPIVDLTFGDIYESESEAAKYLGVDQGVIGTCIKTHRPYKKHYFAKISEVPDDVVNSIMNESIKKLSDLETCPMISDEELYSIDSSIDDTEDDIIDEFTGATLDSLILFGDGCYDED